MTNSRNISKTEAINLAQQYHDVMNMVSRVSAFGLPVGKSPLQALGGYLQACKVCGVTMHNDAWEQEAERVVVLLTQERRRAWAEALGKSHRTA